MKFCSTNRLFTYLFLLKVELPFNKGDIILVFGDMDEDGFYAVSYFIIVLIISSYKLPLDISTTIS